MLLLLAGFIRSTLGALCTILFVRLLDLATKDTEVDVKEIAVWALRIFITNSTCRKVRYFTAQMINFRVVLDAFNCCFHVDLIVMNYG